MPQILADNKYVEGKCKFLKFINECLQFGSNWAKRLHRAFNGCSIKSIHLFFTVSGGTVNLI